MAISTRGLRKSYGAVEALRGVNLDVPRGEICAVLGRNGAGKTTLISAALGLTEPSAGSVSVLGRAAGSLAARRSTGAMLQDADLPDLLTAREHLTFFASCFASPADVDTLIQRTQIGDFSDKRYKALSGGQKRRVQFAVALVGKPDLLFLDEPTTGLDQDARRAVWGRVRELADAGKTIVLTTHYLEEADALADRIVVLAGGRVIADGSASAIRQHIGGALIACETNVDETAARALPAVRSAQTRGRLLTLLSDDAASTLAALLRDDPALKELSVSKPSLEEAVAALTTEGSTGGELAPSENPRAVAGGQE
ncbi:MAG: ABC transporter ATP-binding protein [Pseudomonadota bacterium]